MTTDITFRIEHDQELSVAMEFEIEANGSPDQGWEIRRAILADVSVFLLDDQGEESSCPLTDRTDWLRQFLSQHEAYLGRLESQLSERWEWDQERAVQSGL